METTTVHWRPGVGWSEPLPPWDGPATLVLVLAGPALDGEAVDLALLDVTAAYPAAVVVGCSTAGGVVGSHVEDSVVAVTVLRFAHTALSHAALRVATPSDSGDTGRLLGKQLLDHGPALAGVLVLSDGLRVDGGALAAGLSDGLDAVPVCGGLAGDGSRFGTTWTLLAGRRVEAHVSAVGLYGSRLQMRTASAGGWTPLGPERLITGSRGNVVHEIDGRPALDLYREYLGERAAGLPATALLFPVRVRRPGGATREVVRTVLGVDEQARSLRFAGDVPEGSRVVLLRSTTDRLVDAALDAGSAARQDVEGAVVALAVSCVGRRLYLGRRTDEELEALAQGVSPGTHVVGFYSYGELSPTEHAACELHNQTMTLATLHERPR